MTTENERQEEEMDVLKIPDFINDRGKKNVSKPAPKKRELEFIKVGEENIGTKDWKVLKELDDLVGLILSKQEEPVKSVIEYSLFNNNDNKTERIKGIIKVKN